MDELEKRNVIPVLCDFDKSISLHELKSVIHLRIKELEEEIKSIKKERESLRTKYDPTFDWPTMDLAKWTPVIDANNARIAELKRLLGEEPKQCADKLMVKTVHADAVTKIN